MQMLPYFKKYELMPKFSLSGTLSPQLLQVLLGHHLLRFAEALELAQRSQQLH